MADVPVPNDPAQTNAPPAKDLPPGVTVLATDGTDRSNLRQGVAAWAFLLFTGGFIFGRATAARGRRR